MDAGAPARDIAREIEAARRAGGRLILAFVDVDGLKEVNDEQGHPEGDELLRLTGRNGAGKRTCLRRRPLRRRRVLCAVPGFALNAADSGSNKSRPTANGL